MTVYLRRPFYRVDEDGWTPWWVHEPDSYLLEGLWSLEQIGGVEGATAEAFDEALAIEGYENEPQLVVSKGNVRLDVFPTLDPENDDEFLTLVCFGDLIYVVYAQDLPALFAVMESTDGLAGISE